MKRDKNGILARSILEKVQIVIGVMLILFGFVIMLGIVVGDSSASDWVGLLIFLIISWGPGILLLYLARRSAQKRRQADKDDIFREILALGVYWLVAK